jgi:hypothetical protein
MCGRGRCLRWLGASPNFDLVLWLGVVNAFGGTVVGGGEGRKCWGREKRRKKRRGGKSFWVKKIKMFKLPYHAFTLILILILILIFFFFLS